MLSLYWKMGSEGHENFQLYQETWQTGWVDIRAQLRQGQGAASETLALIMENGNFSTWSTTLLANQRTWPTGHSLPFIEPRDELKGR